MVMYVLYVKKIMSQKPPKNPETRRVPVPSKGKE